MPIKFGLLLQTGSHTAHYFSLTKSVITKKLEDAFATVIGLINLIAIRMHPSKCSSV
jgi:hypothetical protein